MALPRPLPFVVIDMNQIRSAQVVRPILEDFGRTGVGILLPWPFAYEATKGGGNAIAASLRLLRERPEAVSIAHAAAIPHANQERRHRVPATDVVDLRSTANMRHNLEAWRAGAVSDADFVAAHDGLRARAAARVAATNYSHLYRTTVAGFRKDMKDDERRAILAALRKGDRQPYRQALLPNFSPGVFREMFMHGPQDGR